MAMRGLFMPESSWLPPTDFPNLSGEKVLGVDLETKDPNLESKGPGGIRNDGYVVGVSLSTLDKSWYFPFRHADGGNLPEDNVVSFLQDTLNKPRTYVGANLQYELEWLSTKDIMLPGDLIDIQVVEALIDEEQETYNLDSLCRRYLSTSKDETLLKSAAAEYGCHPKSGLWQMHSKYVGPYAEFDALAPIKIWQAQQKEIEAQGLEEILNIELPLTRLLWLMRQQGIQMDLEEASKLSRELKSKEEDIRYEIWKEHQCRIDPWSSTMLASICDRLKILYPRTPKGNPSFEGDWLDEHDHPLLKKVSALRELNRLRDTFVDEWIFGNQISGKIHPQWKQLKADDGGARTGRMAAANPNPQQVPSRSDYAHLVRRLFIPHEGHGKWGKLDYSQQEPRLLVHFAYLCKFIGADLTRMAYRDNPKMDIYQFLADSASISRRESKDITLGRCYGMGAKKLAVKLGISEDAAKAKLAEFDRSVPFVREISDRCAQLAQSRGYIRTICGRRRHFNWWEPANSFQLKEQGKDTRPRKLADAQEKWKGLRLQRAHTHKSLNSLIQGSAADMTKAAMLLVHKETGKIPYMVVHDELNYGCQSEDEAKKIQVMAENCVKMEVPIRADLSYGEHWK
jgi:DNA polymerase I-like protein with 3'-5' exonuclease and polymerase domains